MATPPWIDSVLQYSMNERTNENERMERLLLKGWEMQACGASSTTNADSLVTVNSHILDGHIEWEDCEQM
jgi:hypothetical protein